MPPEFVSNGNYWASEAWLVRVIWQLLSSLSVPQTSFELIAPLLLKMGSLLKSQGGKGS